MYITIYVFREIVNKLYIFYDICGDGRMKIRFALEEVLAEKKMSRYMLAKLTNTNYQIIDNYYKNKVSRYDRDLLLRMCTVLECVPGDLIRLEDTEDVDQN